MYEKYMQHLKEQIERQEQEKKSKDFQATMARYWEEMLAKGEIKKTDTFNEAMEKFKAKMNIGMDTADPKNSSQQYSYMERQDDGTYVRKFFSI